MSPEAALVACPIRPGMIVLRRSCQRVVRGRVVRLWVRPSTGRLMALVAWDGATNGALRAIGSRDPGNINAGAWTITTKVLASSLVEATPANIERGRRQQLSTARRWWQRELEKSTRRAVEFAHCKSEVDYCFRRGIVAREALERIAKREAELNVQA